MVDGRATKSEPKSERGKRTLPLTDGLVVVLERAAERKHGEQAAAGKHYRDTDYLVVNELGERLHPDTISDKWDTLVAGAGPVASGFTMLATPAAR